MPDRPVIRRARKEDVQQVGALWMLLLDEHAAMEPRFDVAADALERWSNDFAYWVRNEQFRVFVAERADEVVGFVTACLWKPLPIYTLVEEVYVNELYVVPAVRGQGVGRRLVEAVRAWAEAMPVSRLRIGVLAANTEGRAFWERLRARPFAITLTIDLETPEPTEKAPDAKARLGF